MAEAAPDVFLSAVKEALGEKPCPFDSLFAQEGDGITGGNYLTGLLRALEGLAWDEQRLVQVCMVLAELASHDPGGRLMNRPSNSLATILLPWLPQTMASIDKRKVAVQAIRDGFPGIGWDLLIQLLPGQLQTTSGSHKPCWRDPIPEDSQKGVTEKEYWEQASSYAELAVEAAGQDVERLSVLVDHIDRLTKEPFERLLEVLVSPPIAELPEDQRFPLWDRLSGFTNKHRRFSDADWALPDQMIAEIEKVAEQLAPDDPFILYRHLFGEREFELYDRRGDWAKQSAEIANRRKAAVSELFQQGGVEGIMRFAESVALPSQVGYALAYNADAAVDSALLPGFLDAHEAKRRSVVCSFVWQRNHLDGWVWSDNIDRSGWTLAQVAQFLACLPFTDETWSRASQWLSEEESEYWARTDVNPYEADGDLSIAVNKLVENGRPHAAIECLGNMRYAEQAIDSSLCVRTLLAATDSNESRHSLDGDRIVELIKFLQEDPSVSREDLFSVEWAYIALLNSYRGASPRLLESVLASDPEFFCEVVRRIYRSRNEDSAAGEVSEQDKAIARNAWRLLRDWKTPPGTQENGSFCEECFTEWLERVKALCGESGHLEVAMINIGAVLIHAPSDPTGLWISRTVASALNARDAADLRKGFRTGKFNARGVHWVDPTGEPERKLAEEYRNQAEEVEDAGYPHFAVTLRELANIYDRDAEKVISDHQDLGG